jgi:hypothetical protein
MQLDIFSVTPCSGREVREFADLPKAVIPLQPKEQIAIASLQELAELRIVDSEFAVSDRVKCGDLRGMITKIVDAATCYVLFDGETKTRLSFFNALTGCSDNIGLVREEKRELAIGCTVKSSKSYRGKTGKLIEFKETAGTKFAMVLFPHGLPLYPCRLSDLEVVE